MIGGGHLHGITAQGCFSKAEMPLSINTKETLAVWYSIRLFRHQLKCKHLLIQSDNTTAVSYIHNMGGLKSDLRNKIMGDVWHLIDDLDIDLSIAHLPRKFN